MIRTLTVYRFSTSLRATKIAANIINASFNLDVSFYKAANWQFINLTLH